MATEIAVPVFGGPQDGSVFLARDLTPGKVYRLAGAAYAMDWRTGKPRMFPHKEGVKYGR